MRTASGHHPKRFFLFFEVGDGANKGVQKGSSTHYPILSTNPQGRPPVVLKIYILPHFVRHSTPLCSRPYTHQTPRYREYRRPAADHPQKVPTPGVLDPADPRARSLQLLQTHTKTPRHQDGETPRWQLQHKTGFKSICDACCLLCGNFGARSSSGTTPQGLNMSLL